MKRGREWGQVPDGENRKGEEEDSSKIDRKETFLLKASKVVSQVQDDSLFTMQRLTSLVGFWVVGSRVEASLR